MLKSKTKKKYEKLLARAKRDQAKLSALLKKLDRDSKPVQAWTAPLKKRPRGKYDWNNPCS